MLAEIWIEIRIRTRWIDIYCEIYRICVGKNRRTYFAPWVDGHEIDSYRTYVYRFLNCNYSLTVRYSVRFVHFSRGNHPKNHLWTVRFVTGCCCVKLFLPEKYYLQTQKMKNEKNRKTNYFKNLINFSLRSGSKYNFKSSRREKLINFRVNGEERYKGRRFRGRFERR